MVVSAPGFHLLLGILQVQEPVLVQALLPEPSVERLDEGVVRGLPGLVEVQLYLALGSCDGPVGPSLALGTDEMSRPPVILPAQATRQSTRVPDSYYRTLIWKAPAVSAGAWKLLPSGVVGKTADYTATANLMRKVLDFIQFGGPAFRSTEADDLLQVAGLVAHALLWREEPHDDGLNRAKLVATFAILDRSLNRRAARRDPHGVVRH